VGGRVVVEAELERVLDGHQPLHRVDLARQRPQQGGLAQVGAAGDQDVAAGPHQGGEEGAQSDVDGADLAQITQRDSAEPVTADRERGPATEGQRHDREQPFPAGQLKAHRGAAPVEPTFLRRRPRREGAHQVDEVAVTSRDRAEPGAAAAGVLDEDPVTAVDVDALDVRVVQQRLQTGHPEQLVHHLDHDPALGALVGQGLVGEEPVLAVLAQRVVDDLTRELPACARVHGPVGALACLLNPPRQVTGEVAPQPVPQLLGRRRPDPRIGGDVDVGHRGPSSAGLGIIRCGTGRSGTSAWSRP
jgi:hypothetical protein